MRYFGRWAIPAYRQAGFNCTLHRYAPQGLRFASIATIFQLQQSKNVYKRDLFQILARQWSKLRTFVF